MGSTDALDAVACAAEVSATDSICSVRLEGREVFGQVKKWWHAGKVRKRLWARFSLSSSLLWPFKAWLCYGYRLQHFLSAELVDYPGIQDSCYCGTGRTTALRVHLVWFWFDIEVSRDWTAKPCCCDKIIWLLFPDSSRDEIEEYGLERLQSEYPDVKAIV